MSKENNYSNSEIMRAIKRVDDKCQKIGESLWNPDEGIYSRLTHLTAEVTQNTIFRKTWRWLGGTIIIAAIGSVIRWVVD